MFVFVTSPILIQSPIPLDQWLKTGLNVLGKNLVPLILISLVMLVLTCVASLLILPLIFVIGPIYYSMYAAAIKGIQGRQIIFEDAWTGFRERFWEGTKVILFQGLVLFLPLLIGGFFIFGAIFIAKAQHNDIVILLGGIFGVLLALSWIVYFFYMGCCLFLMFPIVIDRRLEVMEAFHLSRRAAHVDFLRYFIFYFLSMVLSSLGSFLFSIGIFITWPLIFLFTAAAYQSMLGFRGSPT